VNYRIIVSAVIEKDGAVLLGKKAPGVGPYPDVWHLPGGGANMGEETLVEALAREVREETGIEIENIEPYAFDEDDGPDKHGVMTHYIFLVFKARYLQGALQAAGDIAELRWVKKEELNNFPLTRPSIKLFKEKGLL